MGKKTTGLAISEGRFASQYKTISHESLKQAVEKILKEIDVLGAELIVLGYVEGKIKSYFEKFRDIISKQRPNIKVIMEEESLTSRQARQTMIKLHIPQKKKSEKEHSLAASIILQSYLDSND